MVSVVRTMWPGSGSAMRSCALINIMLITQPCFFEIGLCAVLFSAFVLFSFLIEESYFLCNRPFIDYRCFGVVPKLD